MPPKKSSGRNDKSAGQASSQSTSRNTKGETSARPNQRPSSSQHPGPSQRANASPRKPLSQRATASQKQNATQADRAAAGIDKADLDQKVNDLVEYLLIAWQKNYPIKKLDINKNVLKDHRSAFAHIMKKAQDKLAKVFGLEVVELQDKLKGSFVLVNKLVNDTDNPQSNLQWPADDSAKTGLLMVILSIIFMNGNVMQDSEVWHALKKLGIESDVPHLTFGDPKKLITQEFVRQGYIEYIRQPNVDPPAFELKWGQRALLEISKRNCLNFVSQIYDMEQERWTSQYQDMVETEGGLENGSGDA